jgi:predicted anti-sigma-YlaC factor YlaD
MNQLDDSINCPRAEIAAYLDGELSAQEEIVFEAHLAVCEKCSNELREQRKLLHALNFALDTKTEVALPKDFAKTVAARAENDLSGLKSKNERRHALLLCSALFVSGVLVGVVGKKSGVLPVLLNQTLVQVGAFGNFLLHLAYDTGIGATVILRVVSRQFLFGSTLGWILTFALFISLLIILSRLLIRYHRV